MLLLVLLFALAASAGEATIANYELDACQNFWFNTSISAEKGNETYYDTPGTYESSRVTAVSPDCGGTFVLSYSFVVRPDW